MRHELTGVRFEFVVGVDEAGDVGSCGPPAWALINDYRDDQRQRSRRCRSPVGPQVVVPDSGLIGHHPQRHPRVGCALMLHEQVQVAIAATGGGGPEQQVDMSVP